MINKPNMKTNKQSIHPVIIVVAYDRPDSLQRLLNSLRYARDVHDARLIISIDHQDFRNYKVKEVADSFQWPFGPKEVRYQQDHLGLKKHIMLNGELAVEFGAVIILEDDLFVSPYFYQYARVALDYYCEDERIAGISLYNLPRQEMANLPFAPLGDSSDVYFTQMPSSLGQLWTREQWSQFKTWYEAGPDLSQIALPDYIYHWPESSWKKYYAAYLIDQQKYFVYPRYSLTTNFFDKGTNIEDDSSHRGQTPLKFYDSNYTFISISDSNCVYDIYLELMPDCLARLAVNKIEYEIELDLYGSKEIKHIEAPYVITSRPSRNPLKGFRRALKPHEMNIIMDLEGDDFVLCKKEDIIISEQDSEALIGEFYYYYTDFIKGTKFMLYRYFRKNKLIRQLFR